MTDHEFWTELAEMGAAMRVFPAFYNNCVGNYGLCSAIARAQYLEGVISSEQLNRLAAQLHGHCKPSRPRPVGYFWPRDNIDSRIKACRKLARLALKAGI